jgi:hypothetical protein
MINMELGNGIHILCIHNRRESSQALGNNTEQDRRSLVLEEHNIAFTREDRLSSRAVMNVENGLLVL